MSLHWPSLVLFALLPSPVLAGLHYSKETYADLPAGWRGFLLDHRLLRTIGVAPTAQFPMSLQREQYESAAKTFQQLIGERTLNGEESADYGAVLLRLNRIDDALQFLRNARRKFPREFALASNLGTAWQLSGDLAEADRELGEAVRLAPARWKPFEEAQRKIVQLRKVKKNAFDDFFGIPFTDAARKPSPGGIAKEQLARLPENDVATFQQLALWLPADGLLLWQLAELANAHGDVRTAATLLEGCVGEFGMGTGDIRERRRIYKEAADAIGKLPDSEHAKYRGNLKFNSVRPLRRKFETTGLPAIQKKGVTTLSWLVLAETTVGKPFKPEYLPYLEQLDGLRISVTGFPKSITDDSEVGSFILLENPIGCWFCESPDPTGILKIDMVSGTTLKIQRGQIRVEGVLKLNRNDPEDYLFTIKDSKLKVVD